MIATREKQMHPRVRRRFRTERRARLYKSRKGTVAIVLFLLVVCAFMVLPMVYAILQSLKPIDELFAFPPRFFVRRPTLASYSQVFQLADNLWVPFTRYLFNSVFVSVVGTLAYVLVASFAAYPLAKARFPGAALISNLVVWTMLFRGEVTAIPQYIVISSLGMVDTYWAILLPSLAATMGVFLMQQFITSSLPDSVLEAARIDGANEYRIVVSIVFPSVKPGWLTLVIFTFQGLWNNTGGQYLYSENLKMLPSVLSTISAGGLARAGAASAVAVLMMIPPIALFIYSQNSVMETMSHSGLK